MCDREPKLRTKLIVGILAVAWVGFWGMLKPEQKVVEAPDAPTEARISITVPPELSSTAQVGTAFDAAVGRSATAALAEHAAAPPGLFEANENDPKSEARTEIWSNSEDFAAKATELETIAIGFSTSITDPADLNAAMGALGANCKSCDSVYRE